MRRRAGATACAGGSARTISAHAAQTATTLAMTAASRHLPARPCAAADLDGNGEGQNEAAVTLLLVMLLQPTRRPMLPSATTVSQVGRTGGTSDALSSET